MTQTQAHSADSSKNKVHATVANSAMGGSLDKGTTKEETKKKEGISCLNVFHFKFYVESDSQPFVKQNQGLIEISLTFVTNGRWIRETILFWPIKSALFIILLKKALIVQLEVHNDFHLKKFPILTLKCHF